MAAISPSLPVLSNVTETFQMDVRDAVAARYSCRAFLNRPVAESTVREILERASRAPSGGNVQPWHVHVVAGERRDALIELLRPMGIQEIVRTGKVAISRGPKTRTRKAETPKPRPRVDDPRVVGFAD